MPTLTPLDLSYGARSIGRLEMGSSARTAYNTNNTDEIIDQSDLIPYTSWRERREPIEGRRGDAQRLVP
jgi:hypothetical protein